MKLDFVTLKWPDLKETIRENVRNSALLLENLIQEAKTYYYKLIIIDIHFYFLIRVITKPHMHQRTRDGR